MTMILVDPVELNTASETLRSCATETADIGSQLWACAQCAMPAELAANVNELVSTADRVLDATAADFGVRSTDLANRAAIAAIDPVAAISASGHPSTGVGSVIGGMNIVGGNTGLSPTVMGGFSPYATTSVVGGGGPFGDGGGFFTGGGFSSYGSTVTSSDPFGDGRGFSIGGGFSSYGSTVVTSDPFGDGKGFFTGEGFGSRRGEGPYGGMWAIAQVAEKNRVSAQARIDAVFRNPLSTPTEIRIAMNAQTSLGNSLSHTLAPSVSALEAQHGQLTESEIRAMSPHTLPTRTNIFAGV